MQETLLLSLVVVAVVVHKIEFFNWFFYKIKTKYLRPEVSIFELLTVLLIILISVSLLA